MPNGRRFDPAIPGDRENGRFPRGSFGLALLAGILALALLGLFGGGKSPRFLIDTSHASFTIHTPVRLRSGLFFEHAVIVRARLPIEDAVIGVDAGLWRDITINTMIPTPTEERFAGGQYRFHYGAIDAGEVLIVKIDGQINSPLIGASRGSMTLFDGDRQVATVPLTIAVLP